MAIAAALALVMPSAAMANDADILRESQDRARIEKLMWDYVRAIDSWNAEAYASVFTPDGAFNAVKGSDALRKMVVDMKKSQDDRRAKGEVIHPMHHFMANQTIEFVDPDHARVYYYWQTVFAGRSLDTPPRMAAAGRGIDDVVRIGGKWLIKSRNVAPTD
jgi:ketosteroid isomerase-like protein